MKNSYYMLLVLTGLASFGAVVLEASKLIGAWYIMVMFAFSALIPIVAYKFRENSVVSFLVTAALVTIVVRSGDQHDFSVIGWVTAVSYVPLILQLTELSKHFIEKGEVQGVTLSLLRAFIGLNWLTHCTEKIWISEIDKGLFGFFQNNVGKFLTGVPLTDANANLIIRFAGCVEFSAAFLLGLGLFSRFGAFISLAYSTAAVIMGEHFLAGYTWAIPGWEFCFFLFMVSYPFMLENSAGPISFDAAFDTANKASSPLLRTLSGGKKN